MDIQIKFNKMVEIVDFAGFRIRLISEMDFMEEFYHMEIVNSHKQYGSWLNQFVFIGSENLSGVFYFFPIVSIHGENFTLKESKMIMSSWDDALNICNALNKLEIPYIREFKGENERIQYLKNGYKRINKRLRIEHI